MTFDRQGIPAAARLANLTRSLSPPRPSRIFQTAIRTRPLVGFALLLLSPWQSFHARPSSCYLKVKLYEYFHRYTSTLFTTHQKRVATTVRLSSSLNTDEKCSSTFL